MSMEASYEPEQIARLNPPPEGQTLRGWCLYQNDDWNGIGTHNSRASGFLVIRPHVTNARKVHHGPNL